MSRLVAASRCAGEVGRSPKRSTYLFAGPRSVCTRRVLPAGGCELARPCRSSSSKTIRDSPATAALHHAGHKVNEAWPRGRQTLHEGLERLPEVIVLESFRARQVGERRLDPDDRADGGREVGERLELRHCECGSTIAWEVSTSGATGHTKLFRGRDTRAHVRTRSDRARNRPATSAQRRARLVGVDTGRVLAPSSAANPDHVLRWLSGRRQRVNIYRKTTAAPRETCALRLKL